MAKLLRFDAEARRLLVAGVDKLANAVRPTLGPMGRNAVLEKLTGAPTITNDGVTIAREIQLSDPFENMGAQLVKEVASQTNDVAGDGTTTATVLAQALVREGMLRVGEGGNPVLLRRGIEDAAQRIVAEIARVARPVEGSSELFQIATISANNDPDVGRVIAQALDRVGRDGVITVEPSESFGITLRLTEGLQFDNGYVSPYMVTDAGRMEAVLEDPCIVLTNETVSKVQELMPILEQIMKMGRPLVLIAENVEGPALGMLVANHQHGTFRSVAVKAPGFGNRRIAELDDIAALIGGRSITKDAGMSLEGLSLADVGRARRVVVTENSCTIIDGAGSPEAVEHRMGQIRAALERAQNDADRDKLHDRLARMSGSVALIQVGAATGVELKERQHRVEDALSATKAALEEGIVPGGGTALLHAEQALVGVTPDGDRGVGVGLVRQVLAEPLYWIATNAGYEGSEVVERVRRAQRGHGFNAVTGEIEDLVASGVVDPAKVTRSALQSAVSIASLVLTTETLVVEEVIGNPGSIMAPGFGDLAEGLARPSNPADAERVARGS